MKNCMSTNFNKSTHKAADAVNPRRPFLDSSKAICFLTVGIYLHNGCVQSDGFLFYYMFLLIIFVFVWNNSNTGGACQISQACRSGRKHWILIPTVETIYSASKD